MGETVMRRKTTKAKLLFLHTAFLICRIMLHHTKFSLRSFTLTRMVRNNQRPEECKCPRQGVVRVKDDISNRLLLQPVDIANSLGSCLRLLGRSEWLVTPIISSMNGGQRKRRRSIDGKLRSNERSSCASSEAEE